MKILALETQKMIAFLWSGSIKKYSYFFLEFYQKKIGTPKMRMQEGFKQQASKYDPFSLH